MKEINMNQINIDSIHIGKQFGMLLGLGFFSDL